MHPLCFYFNIFLMRFSIFQSYIKIYIGLESLAKNPKKFPQIVFEHEPTFFSRKEIK